MIFQGGDRQAQNLSRVSMAKCSVLKTSCSQYSLIIAVDFLWLVSSSPQGLVVGLQYSSSLLMPPACDLIFLALSEGAKCCGSDGV